MKSHTVMYTWTRSGFTTLVLSTVRSAVPVQWGPTPPFQHSSGPSAQRCPCRNTTYRRTHTAR